MRSTLLFLLLAIFVTSAYLKGGCGTYHIEGVAYGPNNTILKNMVLEVKVGKKVDTVRTNENGEFIINVGWRSPCPSTTKRTYRQNSKRMNPQYIYIKYLEEEITLQNKWKKHAVVFPSSESDVKKMTWNKDLHFK